VHHKAANNLLSNQSYNSSGNGSRSWNIAITKSQYYTGSSVNSHSSEPIFPRSILSFPCGSNEWKLYSQNSVRIPSLIGWIFI